MGNRGQSAFRLDPARLGRRDLAGARLPADRRARRTRHLRCGDLAGSLRRAIPGPRKPSAASKRLSWRAGHRQADEASEGAFRLAAAGFRGLAAAEEARVLGPAVSWKELTEVEEDDPAAIEDSAFTMRGRNPEIQSLLRARDARQQRLQGQRL